MDFEIDSLYGEVLLAERKFEICLKETRNTENQINIVERNIAHNQKEIDSIRDELLNVAIEGAEIDASIAALQWDSRNTFHEKDDINSDGANLPVCSNNRDIFTECLELCTKLCPTEDQQLLENEKITADLIKARALKQQLLFEKETLENLQKKNTTLRDTLASCKAELEVLSV